MANNFSRADIISAWRFESGALATDEKAVNTLSLVNTPTEDTTNMMEGSCCMALVGASSQYAKIADADLVAFPLKSGDASKIIAVSCWVCPNTVDANKRVIWAKHKNEAGKRCLSLVHDNAQIYLRHNVTGTTVTDLSMACGPMTANQKYFIMVGVDGIGANGLPTYWFCLYSATAEAWYSKAGEMAAGSLSIGTADWRIGADDDLTANCYFDGQIDEVVVGNSRLHNSEGLAIKGGTFPVTGYGIYDYLYDPGVAADTYNGFSSAAAAYKTMKHAFYLGDIINAIAAPETPQAGTATATGASFSVTGISGWTPAAGDLIRFDDDELVYTVESYSGGTIFLARIYQGVTGAGKVISKITRTMAASQDFEVTASRGTAGKPIVFNGGINLSTLTRTGIFASGYSSYFSYNKYFYHWNFSRMNLYYAPASSSHFYYCNFMYFGMVEGPFGGNTYNCIFGDPNIPAAGYTGERSGSHPGLGAEKTVLYSPHIGNGCAWGLSKAVDVTVHNPLIEGYLTSPLMYFNGLNYRYKFINPNLNARGTNPAGKISMYNNANVVSCIDVVLINPLLGNGNFHIPVEAYSSPAAMVGEVALVNINGNPLDNRRFFSHGQNGYLSMLSSDQEVYHTAAPSAKLSLSGHAAYVPLSIKHFIPCEAGAAKTVSAYLRKSSSPISAIALNNGGSGYAVGDFVAINQGGGALGAIIRVNALSGSAINNFTIVSWGFLYSVANGLTTTAITGAGTNALFDVTAIGTGYGSAGGDYGSAIVLPFMRVSWITGSTPNLVYNSADYPMADVNDSWQLVQSASITPSVQGVITVEFFFQSPNPGALAWYDDIGVA